ncbi:MAG: lyase family protein [Planctomycetota bacterium]|nr:lyase family protein [Planctomycetota bacterium]
MSEPAAALRSERDLLGELAVPADDLTGIHARRAAVFDLAGRPVHPALIRGIAVVKRAAARAARHAGTLDEQRCQAIDEAASEVASGRWDHLVTCDAWQGGAGTALHMAINELIANRACQLLGGRPGDRQLCDPHEHVNRHQSTNDVVPTALRIAAIHGVRRLEEAVTRLQEACQDRERAFADIVCLGRTEMMDAVLITMGRRIGAWADAFGRDRWRLSKCEERLRVVNLGGTAVGTGIGAPRAYIFRAVEELRALTGLPLARAENLMDGTANADALAEVAGIIGALAANLIKVADDLRLLASGPDGGIGELVLPAWLEGSSLMPGKINPVIPEAVVQAGLAWLADQQTIVHACARGSLELNPYLPLIADRLLHGCDALARACRALAERCLAGLAVDRAACARHAAAIPAEATALAARLGHQQAGELAQAARASGQRVRELAIARGLIDAEAFAALTAPAAVLRLGQEHAP